RGATPMSWDEKRADGPRYYYRSERVGGRTVKHYVGRGPEAEREARLDEAKRQQRHAQRQAWIRQQADLAPPEMPLKALCFLADLLTKAPLLLAGFHQHKRVWRKRRRCHGATHDRPVGAAGAEDQAAANQEGRPERER